jgi:WD40 repeat protein
MPDREIIALFSVPGGRRLITMERINTASSEPGRRTPARAVLWDLERPESPLATVAEPDADGLDRPPGRGGIPLVAVSSEGRTIATTFPSAGSPETGSVISLWDADTGIERRRISDIRGTITALALGPEALVAAAINDGTIRLWEGRNLTQLPGLYHHQMMVTNLRFSPEGSLLAVAGTGSGVELWDPATNVQMAAVRTPERAVDVGFSPDGETLAATCGETVSLWAIVDPVGRSRLPGSESWPTDLSFDANGRLAVTSLDEEPRIWSPGDCPSKARSIAGVRSSSLTFDEQGRLITVDTEGMRLVDVSVPDSWPIELVPFRGRESESRRANSAPGIPFGSSFARGGSSFVTAGALGSMGGVPIIDTAIEYVRRAQSRMRPWLLPLGASSDRRTVAVARRDDVFLWRSEQPEALQRVVLPSVRRAGSDRDRRAGSTGSGGPGPFWTNVLVSPGGERLYLQSLESGVGLQAWRLEDRSGALHAIPLGWSGQIQRIVAVDLSSDGGTLAVVTARGGVRLIDAVTGELRLFVPSTDLDPDDHATSVAFSPDGKRLAVGLQRGRIALYSLTRSGDAELLAHFPGHIGAVRMLGFDPSGRLLASGGEDKVVQTWDLEEVRGELASLGLDW